MQGAPPVGLSTSDWRPGGNKFGTGAIFTYSFYHVPTLDVPCLHALLGLPVFDVGATGELIISQLIRESRKVRVQKSVHPVGDKSSTRRSAFSKGTQLRLLFGRKVERKY